MVKNPYFSIIEVQIWNYKYGHLKNCYFCCFCFISLLSLHITKQNWRNYLMILPWSFLSSSWRKMIYWCIEINFSLSILLLSTLYHCQVGFNLAWIDSPFCSAESKSRSVCYQPLLCIRDYEIILRMIAKNNPAELAIFYRTRIMEISGPGFGAPDPSIPLIYLPEQDPLWTISTLSSGCKVVFILPDLVAHQEVFVPLDRSVCRW